MIIADPLGVVKRDDHLIPPEDRNWPDDSRIYRRYRSDHVIHTAHQYHTADHILVEIEGVDDR